MREAFAVYRKAIEVKADFAEAYYPGICCGKEERTKKQL